MYRLLAGRSGDLEDQPAGDLQRETGAGVNHRGRDQGQRASRRAGDHRRRVSIRGTSGRVRSTMVLERWRPSKPPRTLKALGWKPNRTITFILFTGEEQGGIGADTFLKNDAAEIPTMDAILVHDTGTGKRFNISRDNLWETAPLMQEIYQPLQEVFDLQALSTRYFGASDHVPFLNKACPHTSAFSFRRITARLTTARPRPSTR